MGRCPELARRPADGPPSPGRTGRPPATSRAQILAAARELIGRDGWEKLTVRRLAAELGVGATTLYHHVRDKDDLLLLLLNEYVEQIPRPTCPASRGTGSSWPPPPCARSWLPGRGRPDTDRRRFRRPAERFGPVAGRSHRGRSHRRWVHTRAGRRRVPQPLVLHRGRGPVRANSARRRNDAERPWRDIDFSSFDESRLPHMAALGDQWPAVAARDIYPQGLRAFVDGLLAQAAAEAP